MNHYIYILKSLKTDNYYIGSTQDISERLERHNQGRSKATRSRRPWHLVYSEAFETRADAVRRENEIKNKKSRTFIEKLVRASRHA